MIFSLKPAKIISFFIVILFLTISGCYSANFTRENIMKLRAHMSEKEVIAIFGLPIKTEARTCGQAIGEPWQCYMWYYGDWRPVLTFYQGDDGVLYLTSWDL